jgi:YHS domain-containing protein
VSGEAFNTFGAFGDPMAVDPVCVKPVNPHNAYWMIWYRGTPYYFCSEECQLKFDHKPEQYRQLVLDRRQTKAVY